MPFPARAAGTCARCSRPFEADTLVTSLSGPTVLPARFEHYPRCPMTPVAAPRLAEPVAHSREPLRVRGRLAGHLFEILIDGLPIDMVRVRDDGIEILVNPTIAAPNVRAGDRQSA